MLAYSFWRWFSVWMILIYHELCLSSLVRAFFPNEKRHALRGVCASDGKFGSFQSRILRHGSQKESRLFQLPKRLSIYYHLALYFSLSGQIWMICASINSFALTVFCEKPFPVLCICYVKKAGFDTFVWYFNQTLNFYLTQKQIHKTLQKQGPAIYHGNWEWELNS